MIFHFVKFERKVVAQLIESPCVFGMLMSHETGCNIRPGAWAFCFDLESFHEEGLLKSSIFVTPFQNEVEQHLSAFVCNELHCKNQFSQTSESCSAMTRFQ